MRVPLAWLAEWIALPPRAQLLARLTSAGLEIKTAEEDAFEKFVTGEVLACEQHPAADRLKLCRVAAGAAAPLEIICGAPNVAAGQRVAVALHGARLPDGRKIKRAKIRGVQSEGMLCSARELGLGASHEGILQLEGAAAAAPGTALADALPLGIWEFEITPNRGDWVSVLGLAREVRANFGGEITPPPCTPPETAREAAADAAVRVDDGAGCGRYLARVVRGVTVAESPAWLLQRLEACGLRGVNNIVDVTNLVMLEFGQPLHAFDLQKLQGVVHARAAKTGEKLRTLDGQQRALSAEDLVIADAAGAVALAGVMGGAESEVRAETRHILIESAHFAPARIRRSARRHGMQSDAAYRFERGVDPQGQARAADRAAKLLAEIAGGEVSRGRLCAEGEAMAPPPVIRLSSARANRLLGTKLSTAEIQQLLARVDVQAEAQAESADALLCRTPQYRNDLHIPQDLIEEVGRIHGFDAIEATLPAGALAGAQTPPAYAALQSVKRSLAASGLVEIITAPWAAADEAAALGLPPEDPRRKSLRLQNPVQSERAHLRTQLCTALLRAAAANNARRAQHEGGLRIFECGRVFYPAENADELPREKLEAAAFLGGAAGAGDSLWGENPAPLFFQAKGIAQRMLAALNLPGAKFKAECDEAFLHPGARGAFYQGRSRLLCLGELHPQIAADFGAPEGCALLCADIDALCAAMQGARPPQLREPSRFPAVQRDLALLLPAEVAAADCAAALREGAGGALHSLHIFDRYAGRGVPPGKISLAFRLHFQRMDRTLSDAEANKAAARALARVQKQFGARLRDGAEGGGKQHD